MARLAELFNEPSAAATLFRHCGAVAFCQGQLLHRLPGQPAGSETLLVDLPQPPATPAFSRRCCLPEAAFAAQPTASLPPLEVVALCLKREVGSQKGPIFRVAQFLRREEPRQQDTTVMCDIVLCEAVPVHVRSFCHPQCRDGCGYPWVSQCIHSPPGSEHGYRIANYTTLQNLFQDISPMAHRDQAVSAEHTGTVPRLRPFTCLAQLVQGSGCPQLLEVQVVAILG